MLDVIRRGFESATRKIRGQVKLTEDNLAPALREVRASLIQADVELGVIKDFLAAVKERSLGEIVPVKRPDGRKVKLGPEEHFIKACHDELVSLMGSDDAELKLDGAPAIVLMVGLQGSGKTTTSGKIARRLQRQGRKPLLIAADIYRPAAVDQLLVIGRKLNVPVFSIKGMKPVDLAKMGVAHARRVGCDVVIIDTAGRLAIDNALMDELEQIKAAVQPDETLFVCDAMIGQDAVRTARTFDARLDFTGFVITKLDGDARGGAALSIKAITGKPVKLLGQGEDLDRLEDFRAEGMADRILGFGDVVGLMKDFEEHVDQEAAEKGAERMLSGRFGYHDFVEQMKMMRRLGPIKQILSRIPGMSSMLDQLPAEAIDDRELDRIMVVINSMTSQERKQPEVMNASRLARIAKGSGTPLDQVEALHDRFLQAREMMKRMGGMLGNPQQMEQMQQMMAGGGLPPGLGGGMPGLGGGRVRPPKPPPTPMSAEERMKRRKARKRRNKK